MLTLLLTACVIDPAATLFAEFEPAELPGDTLYPVQVAELADGAMVVHTATEVVAYDTDGNEVGRVAAARPVVALDAQTLVAPTPERTGLVRSTDGGVTWESPSVPEGAFATTFVTGIFHTADGDVVVSHDTGDEFVQQSVFVSTDQGASFEQVESPVTTGAVFPAHTGVMVSGVRDEGTSSHWLWRPGRGGVTRVHKLAADDVAPHVRINTGHLLRFAAHDWTVDGGLWTWTRDISDIHVRSDWGVLRQSGLRGVGDQASTYGGQSLDGHIYFIDNRDGVFRTTEPLGGSRLVESAEGPRCNRRDALRYRDLDELPTGDITIENNTDVTLLPVWSQRQGQWGERYGDEVAPGDSQLLVLGRGDQSSWLLLEGVEDSLCYGVFEIADPDPLTITVP